MGVYVMCLWEIQALIEINVDTISISIPIHCSLFLFKSECTKKMYSEIAGCLLVVLLPRILSSPRVVVVVVVVEIELVEIDNNSNDDDTIDSIR